MSRDIEQIDAQGMAAWDGHDVDAFVGLFAEEFVWTDLTLPAPMRSRDEARQYMQVEFTGTNTGPMLMGGAEIPPTGKRVVGRGAYFARVDDGGKMVLFSSHPDVAGIMMQLELLPGMG
jgi:SnoaL-like domain